MLLSQLLALLVAAAVFFAVYGFGRWSVENIYMSPESISSRKAAIYAEFNTYVTSNNVSGHDTAAIARWTGQRRAVNILVYREDELNNSVAAQLLAAQYGRLYPMRFADGQYRIAISDTSQERESEINILLAVALAAMAYIAVQLRYTGRLTRRIVSLSREAAEVSAGDLEKPIAAAGTDEIAALARDMDNMRRSVIERLGSERRAWEANSELITAISHDIRTPMTSLIGYLGLLDEDGLTDELRAQFTVSAYGKAMELKDLTDELFRYFLVFGRAELEMNLEPYDAGLLLEQLLGETEFDLRDAGFEVQRVDFTGACTVTADPLYLKRVTDNLVSNIKKYADRSRPVLLLSELADGELTVCFSNSVSRSMERVESTRIGLRTCEKIMAHMSGRFVTRSDEDHFAAEFTLPAAPLS